MAQSNKNVILDEDLFWEIKKEISHDKGSRSFVTYLEEEKRKFNRPPSRPRKVFALTISLILGLFGISSAAFSLGLIIDVILGTYVNPETFPGVPSELTAGLFIAVGIAAFLGIIFSIVTILLKFFNQSNWSSYHDQMLSLFTRLESAGQLDNYIVFDDSRRKNGFKLKQISVDFDIEWVFPFIFDEFPPLLFELLLLSFLLPFFVTTTISIFFAILEIEWISILILGFLLLLIFFGFTQSGVAIYKSWRKYNLINSLMISKQQEVIHSLILENSDNLTIIRHQNNLTRLVSMSEFPLPQVMRVSAIIPLLGSLVGYLIAFLLVT
ncbi:MAG: hypothetical protein JSV04_11390 [Candidatus Heimdallarchaeota archaeon]|nr:MAG: hypothetical protein JSV04_11390 [Candidatus Heimdallarchaeota archaeon]